MACILKTSQTVLIIVIVSIFIEKGSDAVSISINPEKNIATMQNTVHISCVPDSGDDMKKEIALLEISKNDGQLMAALRPCSNITYGSDVANRIQVSGHIDEHVHKTYLNMSINSPVSQDTGLYTCSMHYLEQAILKEDREGKKLLVERLNVSSLETALNSLKERLAVVEQDGMKKVLENTEKITNLENTVTYSTAFSAAASKSHIYPSVGQTVVFPEVMINQGNGYDPKTGMFTAPRAGLYYFNVVTLTCAGCWIQLDLKVNQKVLARLLIDGKSKEEQSSISTVTALAIGDVVKVVPNYVKTNSYINTNAYSLFTGYFIKTL